MKTTNNQHYVYKITNLNPKDEQQYYIGVRSCNCLPEEDIKYMGSSKYLTKAINEQGYENFKKEILSIWSTREEAVNEEIRLHNEYNVHINEIFYNRSKQSSTGWDTAGLTGEKSFRFGVKSSDETKEKIRQANIGKKLPLEQKLKRRAYKHTDEAKIKISKNHPTGNKGVHNPMSKIWLVSNPEKTEFIIDSGLVKFCKKHGLKEHILKSFISRPVNSKIHKYMNGWQLDEIQIINSIRIIISTPKQLLPSTAKIFNIYDMNDNIIYSNIKLQDMHDVHASLYKTNKYNPLGINRHQIDKLKQFNKLYMYGWYAIEIEKD